MKFTLILLFAVLVCNCSAFLNPITGLRNYGQRKMNDTRNKIYNSIEYGMNLKRTASEQLNNLMQYSGKTLNDAKIVRSFGDASNLGKTLINYGYQTTKSYVKFALYGLDEETRKRLIMRDCISHATSQLNADDLKIFLQVSNQATVMAAEVIIEKFSQPSVSDQVQEGADGNILQSNNGGAQGTSNQREEIQRSSLIQIDTNQSKKYLEILTHFGNAIPDCYHYNVNLMMQNKK